MYGVAGERRLTEWELPWLPGYEGSKPVRVGNGAHDQLQLDVYGEVMDALHQARVGGIAQIGDGLGPATPAARAPGGDLGATGLRLVGSARAAAALHAFEDHGVGRVRPRHQGRGGLRVRMPARALAASCAQGSTRRSASAATTRSAIASCRPTASKQLDASLLQIPELGFLPLRRSARARHDPRDRVALAARRLRPALRHRETRTTACRPARAPSSRAVSGSRMRMR